MTQEILNASSNRLSHSIRENHERKSQERKRGILYLIKSYLEEYGLEKTAETLSKEANMVENYEVCDNVDLDTILQEYSSYYYAKFNKHPKICKKVNEKIVEKKRHSLGDIPQEKIKRPVKKSLPTEKSENFEIYIKEISSHLENTNKKIDVREKPSFSDIEHFIGDNFTPEWKELAEYITKEIINPNDLYVSFADCIGLEKVIQFLKEAVFYPILYPNLFSNMSPWKGILLYGPPGTGKTLVAKAMASESNTTFINVTPSSFISKWRGDSEKLVRVLFEVAKLLSPTTIFIDELDALASRRDEKQHEASRRFKSELITQMDGILKKNEHVFILATTNLPWEVDAAILRRFDKRILVDLPNDETRMNIIKKYLNQTSENGFTAGELTRFAELTENYSGSDLKLVCKNAYMSVVRREIERINKNDKNSLEKVSPPTIKDFETAISNTKPSHHILREKYLDWQKDFGCI